MLSFISSERPLLVAAGPIASAELRESDRYDELGHVDRIVCDGEPGLSAADVELLQMRILPARTAVVFVIDARDEAWWRVLREIAPLDKLGCPLHAVVVRGQRAADDIERGRALSAALSSCVIAIPDGDDLVRAAIVPFIALADSGLMCFHVEDMAALLSSPAIARVATCRGRLSDLVIDGEAWTAARAILDDPAVARVFVLFHVDADTALQDISAVCDRIERLAVSAGAILVASTNPLVADRGDVDVLAIRC